MMTYYDEFDWSCPMCHCGAVEVFDPENAQSHAKCRNCGWQGVQSDFVGQIVEEKRR